MHNDEAGVGRAVKESGISREKIWITSKLWPTEYGESKTLEAIDKILEHMQLDLFTSQYKPQNKMFHFCKTFCSKITLVNTIQNVI